MRTATQTVLSLPELLTQILLNLTTSHPHLRTLLLSQRVSHTFLSTIAASPALRRALNLAPNNAHLSKPAFLDSRTHMLHHASYLRTLLYPFVKIPLSSSALSSSPEAGRGDAWVELAYSLTKRTVFFNFSFDGRDGDGEGGELKRCLEDKTGSWRKMFLHPASFRISRVVVAYGSSDSTGRRAAVRRDCDVTGKTVGELLDLVREGVEVSFSSSAGEDAKRISAVAE